MEFLAEYGLFVAKTITLVIAVLIAIGGIVAIASRGNAHSDQHLEIIKLNDEFEDMADQLKVEVLDKDELKRQDKDEKKKEKAEAKLAKTKAKAGEEEPYKPRLFVLDFDGDIQASAVDALRDEISAVLTLATPQDEIFLRLESGGGMVHSYGLAASQLQRIKNKKIPLTISVDKVAASGGYMMACMADRIIAAPFAIIGSIGVIAQLPNFHRLLKKNDIDFEMFTAGEYKRTVTMFGENSEKGRAKFVEELEDTHGLFKEFVSEQRASIDIEAIATGEVWYGKRAIDQNLVDELLTSDEYLFDLRDEREIFKLSFVHKKTLPERLGLAAEGSVDRLAMRWLSRLQQSRFFS